MAELFVHLNLVTLKKEVNNCVLLWQQEQVGEIRSHTALRKNPWPRFHVWGSVECLDMPLCTYFTFLIKIEQL